MAINARVITRPDPGATPGGSTTSSACWHLRGRVRIDGWVKTIAFARVGFDISPIIVVANDNYAEEVALAA